MEFERYDELDFCVSKLDGEIERQKNMIYDAVKTYGYEEWKDKTAENFKTIRQLYNWKESFWEAIHSDMLRVDDETDNSPSIPHGDNQKSKVSNETNDERFSNSTVCFSLFGKSYRAENMHGFLVMLCGVLLLYEPYKMALAADELPKRFSDTPDDKSFTKLCQLPNGIYVETYDDMDTTVKAADEIMNYCGMARNELRIGGDEA